MSGSWPAGLFDSEAMETMLSLGSKAQVTVRMRTELNVQCERREAMLSMEAEAIHVEFRVEAMLNLKEERSC